MEQFDNLIRAMAKKEECIVPEGFDQRMREVLDGLPSKAVKKGRGVVKTALIAAAVCAALLGTAFAASPGLREMLAGALGGFAPYAQEQDGQAYVIDGIEVRVLSAMADQDTIRVYAQLKDLEGNRLSENVGAMALVDIPKPDDGGTGIHTSLFGAECLGYDEAAGAALMAFSTWGQVYADLSDAELRIFLLYDTHTLEDITEDAEVRIPLDIEATPAAAIGGNTELAAGFFAESMRLSPLGLTAVTFGDTQYTYLAGSHLRLAMADGTEILSCSDHVDGQGSYGEYDTDSARRILIWNFPEPLDVEQIQSVTIIDRNGGERTFPMELP